MEAKTDASEARYMRVFQLHLHFRTPVRLNNFSFGFNLIDVFNLGLPDPGNLSGAIYYFSLVHYISAQVCPGVTAVVMQYPGVLYFFKL